MTKKKGAPVRIRVPTQTGIVECDAEQGVVRGVEVFIHEGTGSLYGYVVISDAVTGGQIGCGKTLAAAKRNAAERIDRSGGSEGVAKAREKLREIMRRNPEFDVILNAGTIQVA